MFGSLTLGNLMSISTLEALYTYWPFAAAFIGNSYLFVIATTVLTFILIKDAHVKYAPNMLNDLKSPRTRYRAWPSSLDHSAWPFRSFLMPGLCGSFSGGSSCCGYLISTERRIAYAFISSCSCRVDRPRRCRLHLFADQCEQRSSIDHTWDHPRMLAISAWIQNNKADAEPLNTWAVMEIETRTTRQR